MHLDIQLDRFDRCFIPGDVATGVVVLTSEAATSHGGIKLVVEGMVNLQLSARSVGVFEAFYSSIKPMQLLSWEIDISSGGKIKKGKTEYPFEFKLVPRKGMKLHETYHGVYINVQYTITVEMARSMLAKNLKKQIEFIVKANPKLGHEPSPVDFAITPDKLKNVSSKRASSIPEFSIKGQFASRTCNVDEPFGGYIIVEKSDQPIKSIELQFVRVETCSYAETEIKEATEVQNIQIADGDVARGMKIPIYMIFPRLFTSISTSTKNWKVQFEVNVVVLFKDNHMLTENFPIKLIRAKVDSPF